MSTSSAVKDNSSAMKAKTNPTLIGIFVLGAILLITLGVLVFGSGKFFRETQTFVLYFQGDVANLRPGAPVTFRGVKIGSVTSVVLNFDAQDMSLRIPVFIEIDQSQIRMMNGYIPDEKRRNIMLKLVDMGLRAQLRMQSILTGLLSVDFDFHPNAPPHVPGEKVAFGGQEYVELPTIPSEIERLQKTLKQLPFETMVAKAISSLEAMEEMLHSEEMKKAVGSFTQTMTHIEALVIDLNQKLPGTMDTAGQTLKDIRRLVNDMDETLESVGARLDGTLEYTRRTARSTERLMENINTQVRPITESFAETLVSTRAALKQMEESLSAVKGIASNDTVMGYKLYSTLDELSEAARAVRTFADYLERHPEALIRGKGEAQYP